MREHREPQLRVRGLRGVMVFADDAAASCAWWASVLDGHVQADDGYHWFELPDGAEFGFHPVDESKNPPGASTVPYIGVTSLGSALDRFVASGAVIHRGPLEVDGWRMAQVMDPFGAVIGFTDR